MAPPLLIRFRHSGKEVRAGFRITGKQATIIGPTTPNSITTINAAWPTLATVLAIAQRSRKSDILHWHKLFGFRVGRRGGTERET